MHFPSLGPALQEKPAGPQPGAGQPVSGIVQGGRGCPRHPPCRRVPPPPVHLVALPHPNPLQLPALSPTLQVTCGERGALKRSPNDGMSE